MIKKVFIVGLLIFGSCNFQNYLPDQNSSDSIKQEKKWHAIAEFFAGREITNPLEFPELVQKQKEAYYIDHKNFMLSLEKKVKEGNIKLMKEWQKRNLIDEITQKTAMYPLSGADILNFFSLFPNASQYIMIALEKPGFLSDVRYLNDQQTIMGLYNIRTVLMNISAVNYFFSKTMRETLINPIFSGVLPVMLIFSIWLDFNVHKVEFVAMEKNGQVVEATFNNQDLTHGVRILFKKPNDIKIYSLTYWNMFLSNQSVESGSSFKNYLDSKGELNIMFKAAVYLMHDPKYNKLRDYFLNKASLILQDDSGIPYRNFNLTEWEINLYGQFTRPATILGVVPPNPVQPELAKAFQEKSKELPFQFGYGTWFGQGRANMLIAKKKK